MDQLDHDKVDKIFITAFSLKKHQNIFGCTLQGGISITRLWQQPKIVIFQYKATLNVHIVRKVNNHLFEVKHFYAHNGKNLQNHFSCNIMEIEKGLLDFCKKNQIGK